MGESNCKRCGAVCSEEYKFCPNCGASLDSDKCPQCGAELIDGAKFCVSCGACIGEVNTVVAPSEKPSAVQSKTEAAKPAAQAIKKPKFTKSAKTNYIVRIIKNASVCVLCTILFALSFCDIIKVNADYYFDFQVEGCEVNVSAVDVINIMFSTADLSGDEERFADELDDLNASLGESIRDDYNSKTGKYYLSAKTKKILHDTWVCYCKDNLADDKEYGSSEYNNFIISGVFCFLNILFTAAMLIVGIISLVSVVLKKKNKVAKYLYAMPAYLFVTFIILFLVKTAIGAGSVVAGAMGATLFFELAAIITAVVLIFSAKKKKDIKNAIPRLVSTAMSIIICACLFAPVFTAKYDLVLGKRSHKSTYSISVDAGGLLTYLSPGELDELPDDACDNYSVYIDGIEQIMKEMSDSLTPFELKEGGETITRMIMVMLIYAAGSYTATGALSVGYYVLLLVFILFGAFVLWSIAGLFKKDNSIYCLFIPILILIVTALGCSIGWICIMNYHLDALACSFTVVGGLISAIVLSALTLVFVGIFPSIANREKHLKTDDDLAATAVNAESIA